MSEDKEREGDKSLQKSVSDPSPEDIRAFLTENPEIVEELVIRASYHQGPLPSPQYLEEYKRVDPGILPHILKSAKDEQDNRHKVTWEVAKSTGRGQWLTFTIIMTALILGAILMYSGVDIGGYISFSFAGVLGLGTIISYIIGSRARPD